MKHVARVIEPRRIIADLVLVEESGCALVGGVEDPNGADAEVLGGGEGENFVPEGFVEFLGEC